MLKGHKKTSLALKKSLLNGLIPKTLKKKNLLNRRKHWKNKMAGVFRFGLVDCTLCLQLA
jgi:hypothetical protein